MFGDSIMTSHLFSKRDTVWISSSYIAWYQKDLVSVSGFKSINYSSNLVSFLSCKSQVPIVIWYVCECKFNVKTLVCTLHGHQTWGSLKLVALKNGNHWTCFCAKNECTFPFILHQFRLSPKLMGEPCKRWITRKASFSGRSTQHL